MKAENNKAVVLIHGLWMKGYEMFYIKWALQQQGYSVYSFRYSSINKSPAENAELLSKFIFNIKQNSIHYVAHSLGGVVLSHFFSQNPVNQTSKVVLLASPVNGSAAAKHVAKNKILKWLLGKSIIKGLLGDNPAWPNKIKTCVIAGVNGFGVGSVLARSALAKENDGTVNLTETVIDTAIEHHVVEKSHFTLLFSSKVMKIIIMFFSK